MARTDESKDFIPVRIAVLTVSDTRTPEEDRSGQVLVEPWIEEVYALEEGLEAFRHAARPGAKKVLLAP